jgi:glycosyltransferase involved in cell wall biosynthesis
VARLRILVVSFFAPAAGGRAGGTQETALLILALAKTCDVYVLYLRGEGEPEAGEELAAAGVRVEEVEGPPPRRSPLQRAVRSVGIAYGWCRGQPRAVSNLWNPAVGRRLSELWRSWRPDVVHFEHTLMGCYVDAVEPSVPCVLRVLQPIGPAARDEVASRHGVARLAASLDARCSERFERRVVARVDSVIAFTEEDRQALEALNTGTLIVRIGIAVATPERTADPARADDRTVAFVGNFMHRPNVDAAESLASRILPVVRSAVPQARLLLVGIDSERLGLDSDEVVALGPVPSVFEPLEEAALVALPLRTGGGMRVKLFEALALGKPVVATARAAAGFGVVDGEHIVLAETDEEFAEAIVALLGDRGRREELGSAARAWALEQAGAQAAADSTVELYARLTRRDLGAAKSVVSHDS